MSPEPTSTPVSSSIQQPSSSCSEQPSNVTTCSARVSDLAETLDRRSPASPRRAKNRARDLAIFKKVTLENYTHHEIAQIYGLDKSRVSQIVARMRRQVAQAERDDPNIEDPLARQRLETRLEQMRLEFLLSKATDALQKQPVSLTTATQGTRKVYGELQSWNVATRRDIPPTAQIINAYLRISRRLGELRDAQFKDHPIPAHLQQDDLLNAINEAVRNWLTAAPKFAKQPSDHFLAAMRAFKKMLGSYLWHRRAGFSPAHSWPPQVFGVPPEPAPSLDIYSPTPAGTSVPQSGSDVPPVSDALESNSATPAPSETCHVPPPISPSESLKPQVSSLEPDCPQKLTNPPLSGTNTHPPLTMDPIILQHPI